MLSSIWRKQEGPKEDPLRHIVIKNSLDVPALDVQDLCASVGWSRREPDLITKALSHSLAVVSAWEHGFLVGFARATGDKVFNATIWDVAVRPSHQRLGIGGLLLAELLKEIDKYDIPLITLYADPGTDSFYKKFGFFTDSSGVRGMFLERE